MVFIWESTKPWLSSKSSLFKKSLQVLKVIPQLSPLVSYLPYLTAFKWGTLGPCTSKSIKNTTSEIWKLKFYQVNINVFNFELSYLWYPLRVKGNTIPHLKALRYGKNGPRGLSWITTLMPVWGSWKMGIYYINGALSKLNCYAL